MEHLDFTPTPIIQLPYYSNKWGCNVVAKRDDLFAQAGGGSKARMLQYILYPLVRDNTEVLVTAGGPCSNYNRAAALLCAHYGIQLELISYTDEPKEWESLNHKIVKLAGAHLTFCKKDNVPTTIEQVVESVSKSGKRFSHLYGGGRQLEGFYAYYDAVKELREQSSTDFDEVFVACGTGTTLTGICAGMHKFFPNAIVHAISNARLWNAEKSIIEDDMKILNDYLGTSYDFSNMRFHEEFLAGGYAKTCDAELSTIRECISNTGMLVDPTYSGKAFWGMSEIISKENSGNKNILFWNTGGQMNLMTQINEFGN